MSGKLKWFTRPGTHLTEERGWQDSGLDWAIADATRSEHSCGLLSASLSLRCRRLEVVCCIQHLGLSFAATQRYGPWSEHGDWIGGIEHVARGRRCVQQGSRPK